MDRDKRWERVERAYGAIVDRKGTTTDDFLVSLAAAYAKGQSDETLEPLINPQVPAVKSGDVIICTNYRADRARELMQVLTDPTFTGFQRSILPELFFVSFTSYGQEASPNVKVAFFAEPLQNYLAEEVSRTERYQLHVAETEKYAHVTYFLNAGRETPLAGEERVLVPSPKVTSYDQAPVMSAERTTAEFVERFVPPMDFGVINYANPDMVGHTGNASATIKAIEAVDRLLGSFVPKLLKENVSIVITADHGNCEQMIHPETGEIDKEHTINPVPFFLLRPGTVEARKATFRSLADTQPTGVLADVAPTMLSLVGIPVPAEMTGQSLVEVI